VLNYVFHLYLKTLILYQFVSFICYNDFHMRRIKIVLINKVHNARCSANYDRRMLAEAFSIILNILPANQAHYFICDWHKRRVLFQIKSQLHGELSGVRDDNGLSILEFRINHL